MKIIKIIKIILSSVLITILFAHFVVAQQIDKNVVEANDQNSIKEEVVKVGEKSVEPVIIDCQEKFMNTGQCPKESCQFDCYGGIRYEGCDEVCVQKECIAIDAKFCPTDNCQLVDGCNNEKICYPKVFEEGISCGDVAYAGNLECCKGLVKRCGVEFFDGTCDMTAENSVYGTPICLPCGNGICNQFENACNCKEDCAR